jgi:hypothetical protein
MVEPTMQASPWMQRHRYQTIRIGEEINRRIAHQGSEWGSERASPFVFERVDDVPERPLVFASGSSVLDDAGSSPA